MLDVVASAKRITGASENEKAALPIHLYGVDSIRKFVRHCAIQSIVRMRPVEGDPGDRSLAFKDDVLVL